VGSSWHSRHPPATEPRKPRISRKDAKAAIALAEVNRDGLTPEAQADLDAKVADLKADTIRHADKALVVATAHLAEVAPGRAASA
jgi:hypothetical protein